ncbi:MBL fold metallo-hydrolase [Amycolatopsis nigrescens]|uniref:MBL fold metallo-hydrolase n=1 Tax=Amycolatopsis nigrescens TaxID=381445 RepID=UPI00037A25D7|nr:MBL fold metallo-hydrolase [Amycolatopsis nigrescens]
MQYSGPRADCPVCEDERNYVPAAGQRWTSLEQLRASGYTGRLQQEAPGIIGIGTEPKFAISQRALLVRAASGNVLWDCISYLDDDLVALVKELGGISAIAISHPHYYGAMVEWSRAFDVPIYLHENDAQWIGRSDPAIQLWSGRSKQLAPDLTLLNLGVHFAGGTVLHWRDGAEGKGTLLSGDIVQVTPDPTVVTFMYSFPTWIPERPSVVRTAVELLEPYEFDTIHGAWWNFVVPANAHEVVRKSAKRYLEAVS